MKLSLFLMTLTLVTAMDSETFQPIQRITNFPIRDTSYMGPFRNTLEEKVQTLMKQRRKVSTLSATELSANNNNKINAKVKTLVPRSVITNLSARRPAVVATTPTHSPSSSSSSENYNELFLDLSQMSVKPKKKLHHLAGVKTNSNSIKPLNAKKSTTNELATKAQSEYFQSDTFKKNKSRQNNPLRLKRLQLLHDQSFLEKHQKLGSFIFSKNQDNLDMIAMATTTIATTTTTLNQIQAAKQANKKNRKLNEVTPEEKSNTFQNRLPNLRDSSSSSSSSESQNAKIIFNPKEKLEDLNRNETSSLEEEVDEKNELKETKPKNEFETQSTLINDEERAAARKRFRDPTKKANIETEKSNTLSMQRHFNPNAQQQHQQFHHHNNNLQQQQQQNQFNHQQHKLFNRQEMFKPLSLKKPTNIDHPLRPNNYFVAKERLLSTQGPNAEFYKPSNYYQHNKVPNIVDADKINQPQGPLPSGFHFKLLKSKRPQTVATEVIMDTIHPAITKPDNVDKANDQIETIVQSKAKEEKLVENVVAKKVDVNVVNEPTKEETAQVVETQREEIMKNKDDEPVLTNVKEEVQVEKEELVKDKETNVLDLVANQETLKETESVVA